MEQTDLKEELEQVKTSRKRNTPSIHLSTYSPASIMITSNCLLQTLSVFLVLVCICHFTESKEELLNRSKRGFRLGAANRVAHGFGKRGYVSPPSDTTFQRMARDALDNLVADDDEKSLDWSIMSVDDMASLLQSRPTLARALVKKFVDIDGDGSITAEELFRTPLRRK